MSSQPPAAAPDANLPNMGDLLVGKYRIERVLGRGGMGIVYAATHELLCQRVAVKLLLSEAAKSPESATRFLNEARAAARIQGENVARVSDVGMLDTGIPYMVMEFLEGSDLNDLLSASGPLAVPVAADYLLQALEAIAQAHALGIVHRDLKPANLFLARRLDGTAIVKVLDFGISKTTGVLGEASSNTSTQTMLGSPYYMSPEQLRSSKNVDRRTDIWSLGVILYELLTGTQPYKEETLGALFAAILENEPPPLSVLRPDAGALDAIYRRCLRRNPDERFGSAQELAAALAPFCTPKGHASVERLAHLGPAPALPPRVMGPGGTTGRGQTAASWGTSSGQAAEVKKPSRAPAIMAAAVASVVLVGGGIVAARTMFSSSEPAASASASAAAAAAPVQPTASTAAAAPATAPSAASATPSAVASAQPAAEPTTAPSATQSAAAAPATPNPAAQARPQGKPRPLPHTASTSAPGYDPTKDTRR